MIKIRTRYRTTPVSGQGVIVAYAEGKQRTTKLDYEQSWEWNHLSAARWLARSMGYSGKQVFRVENRASSNSLQFFEIRGDKPND